MFYTFISATNLEKNLNNHNWVVLDCRYFTKGAHKNQGEPDHIPNAQFAYINTDLSSIVITGKTGRHPLPNPDYFARKLQEWGINNQSQVVVYDDISGAYAARCWWLLNWVGHHKVAVLDGGLSAWKAKDFPMKTEVVVKTSQKFSLNINNQLFQTADEVTSLINNKKKLLIDSRSPERYQGRNETLDPIAGHIPSAINYYYENNLDNNGNMLSKESLKKNFDSILGKTSIEDITFYCGSGVTATLNILSMVHAGFGFAKLYAGSWSDWITDTSRPIIDESN
jgi:thiosulfate/3-mercaptopyruvate sulfurtransferase